MNSNPGHACDLPRLSAYYDKTADQTESRTVEEHLTFCPDCRRRLAEYARLGEALRAEEEAPIPAALDARVAALLRIEPKPSRPPFWRLQPAWAATLAIALIGGVLLFGLLNRGGRGGVPVAVAYPCENPAECAVEVRFAGPVDHDSIERSLSVDPPVPITITWHGNILQLKMAEPLQPGASYTVTLKPKDGEVEATPFAVSFVAGEPNSPVSLATSAPAGSLSSLTPTETMPPPSPSPVPETSATPTPAAQGPAIQCVVQPTRGFGALYRANSALAAHLGCARQPERSVEMVAQTFEKGFLLWQGDRRQILALLDDGRWRSYPDTFEATDMGTPAPGEPVRGFGKVWREDPALRAALGPPSENEHSSGLVIEEFEHGLLLWTADHTIYALYDDGFWERYKDTFVEPTVTRTPRPQTSGTPVLLASPTAVSPTSTPRPATPTAAPTAPNCQYRPVRGFGVIYQENPDVANRLGCARALETTIQFGAQPFEHGLMLWRPDTREILVLQSDGPWSVSLDTWQEGEVLGDGGNPPAGMYVPDRGFGKLWRLQPGLRQALGWATDLEKPLDSALQDFTGGQMLWTGDRVIYVLYADHSWQKFTDTFVEPGYH